MAFRNNGGWALYADSQYTQVSPLNIPDTTEAQLTIDGLGSLTNKTQRPKVSIEPYNTTTQLITQFVVDQVTFYRVFFFAEPSTNNTILFVKFRIPGNFDPVVLQANLARGNGVRQPVTLSVPVFADSLSLANGYELWVEAVGGDVDIDTITIMAVEDFIPV